jgi:predicted nuclease of restriction endonuclease-like (RecB) superfamily
LLLINKVQSLEAAAFYANQTVEKGWSRDLLLNAIKMDSFSNQQIKSHNFIETLPVIHSEYANEVFKDNYNLGFLGITTPIKELALEKRLTEKIKNFVFSVGQRLFVYRQPTPLRIQW